MVVLPAVGGWWVDPWPRELSRAVSAPSGYKEMSRARSRRLELTCDLESSFEAEQTARSYRTHFLGYEHYNFCAVDENLGPVVLSLKTYSEAEKEDAEESENTPLNHTRVVVRFSPCLAGRAPSPHFGIFSYYVHGTHESGKRGSFSREHGLTDAQTELRHVAQARARQLHRGGPQ